MLSTTRISPSLRIFCAIHWILLVVVVCSGCRQFSQRENSNGLLQSLSIKRGPDERTICIETARKLAEHGHAKGAISLLEKAERLGPQEAKLDALLAPLYAQTQQYGEAISRYRQQLTQDGNNADLINNLAWTLLEAGRYTEARDAVKRGLEIAPEHSRLTSTLAMVHYRSGDRKAALAEFTGLYGESAAHHNLALLDIEANKETSAKMHADTAVALGASPATEALQLALNHSKQPDDLGSALR